MRSHIKKEAGITLVETLLVVGLLSGVMLVLTLLLNDYAKREQARGVAGQMALVTRAVTETYSDTDAFHALYSLAEEGGNVAELSILHPANNNINLAWGEGIVSLERGGDVYLADEWKRLPASTIVYEREGNADGQSHFHDTLPIRASSYVTYFDGPGDNTKQEARLTILVHASERNGQKALEILIVTVDRLSFRDIHAVAAEMDANGGLITAEEGEICKPGDCTDYVRGAFGNWAIPLEHFLGTLWYDHIYSGSEAGGGEGYLASFIYLNESVIAGDYLYRQRIAGDPSLNTMYAPLDLGQNNLLGVDNMEVSSSSTDPAQCREFDTSGCALVVNNTVYAKGSTYVGGNLRLKGDLQSRQSDGQGGDIHAANLMLKPAAGMSAGSSGSLDVGGTFSADEANIQNNMSVMNNAQIHSVSARDLTAENIIAETIDMGTGGILVGTLQNGILHLDKGEGYLKAGKVAAPRVTAQAAGIVQGKMGGSIEAGDLQGKGASKIVGNKVQIDNLIECKSGC